MRGEVRCDRWSEDRNQSRARAGAYMASLPHVASGREAGLEQEWARRWEISPLPGRGDIVPEENRGGESERAIIVHLPVEAETAYSSAWVKYKSSRSGSPPGSVWSAYRPNRETGLTSLGSRAVSRGTGEYCVETEGDRSWRSCLTADARQVGFGHVDFDVKRLPAASPEAPRGR